MNRMPSSRDPRRDSRTATRVALLAQFLCVSAVVVTSCGKPETPKAINSNPEGASSRKNSETAKTTTETSSNPEGASSRKNSETAKTTTETSSDEKPADGSDFPPLFVDWPQAKPDLVFVLTGEMYGYMRPCGCSPGQHGGLARRGGFLKFLEQQKQWNILPIDLGDLIEKNGMMESLRYDYALKSLKALDYPIVGIGKRDLGLGITEFLGRVLNPDDTSLVLSNIKHHDDEFDKMLTEYLPSTVFTTRGDVKVGVADLFSDRAEEKPRDDSVAIKPIDESVGKILQSMKAEQAEIKVLLAHMSADDAAALAEKHSGFDVILCLSTHEDAARQDAKMVGNTMVTWVGRKGKAAGTIGYWRSETPHLRFEMVPLDLRFDEAANINDIYAKFVSEIETAGILDDWPRTALPNKNEFVGAKACNNGCHDEIYAHWKTTGHAHAFDTLQTKATPPGQDANPECVQCHVVGFGYVSGYATGKAELLGGVQCENCHGPGKLHADSGDKGDIESPPLDHKDIERHCIKCHDSENDLDFNFKRDYPKVAHP